MGRTRPLEQGAVQEEEEGVAEEQIAAAIALILAGAAAVPNPALAVAGLLLLLAPTFLAAPLRARISADVARLMVGDLPAPESPGEAEIRAHRDNLLYRGLYGIAAVKRIALALRGPSEEGLDERLEKAWRAEGSYFEAHRNASARRLKGARLNDAMVQMHGPILSWVHLGTAKTHRRSHERAHGKNYRIDSPPRATGGMLPGQARYCDCAPGPPVRGGRMLK